MNSKTVVPIGKDQFESKVKNSNEVVVVDFGAEWCPPCKALLPTLEKIGEEYKGKVSVYTVDTEKDAELAADFNIRGLPTVLVFKNGKLVETIVGRRQYDFYESVLISLLIPDNI